jgi:hypothetical protein
VIGYFRLRGARLVLPARSLVSKLMCRTARSGRPIGCSSDITNRAGASGFFRFVNGLISTDSPGVGRAARANGIARRWGWYRASAGGGGGDRNSSSWNGFVGFAGLAGGGGDQFISSLPAPPSIIEPSQAKDASQHPRQLPRQINGLQGPGRHRIPRRG